MNHTKGPWTYVRANPSPTTGEHLIAGAKPGYLAEVRDCGSGDVAANARLIAAAPTQHEEMLRFLPIIERAEADPELWGRLTAGTGIATANGYRAAIKKAAGAQP